ncbi:hypothetical protein CTAYLR_007916 [Chrysophaeum taylorii]|uniref:TFIIS N-terminal domain-containing protein n=1 Tax=Chrysophaeum taylorii TaxID=2483200 RepID=A0AAD7XJK1_9STRA|nr:hypothetical protein CTAYLR_007916 [Chrysophaeum taylorii]
MADVGVGASEVKASAQGLLGGSLAPQIADGTLSKKQLRVAVASELGLEAEALKGEARLKEALDEVFGAFVSSLREKKEDPPPKDEATALLRGKLVIEEGKASWKGAWAFTRAAWEKGERSNFKLVSSGWDGGLDGRWVGFSGHFNIGSKKAKEKGKLRFSRGDDGKYAVEGRGRNEFGSWRIEFGIYEPKSGRLSARRAYDDDGDGGTAVLANVELAEEDDEDDDYDEEEEEGEFSFVGVAMRGTYDQETWHGEWAATGDALAAGDVETFEYSAERGAKKTEFAGSFVLRDGDTKRDVKERFSLKFSGRKCKGRGRNELGDFLVSGELRNQVLRCSKTYQRPEDDSDDDEEEEDREALAEELAELAAEARQSTGGGHRLEAKRRKRRAAGDELVAEKRRRETKQDLVTRDDLEAAMRDIQLALNNADDTTASRLISNLKPLVMTVDLLAETGIGKFIGKLKKHDTPRICALARSLVDKWKQLVRDQSSKSSSSSPS